MTATHISTLFGIPARGTKLHLKGIATHTFTEERKIVLSEYNWNAIAVMKELLDLSSSGVMFSGVQPSLHTDAQTKPRDERKDYQPLSDSEAISTASSGDERNVDNVRNILPRHDSAYSSFSAPTSAIFPENLNAIQSEVNLMELVSDGFSMYELDGELDGDCYDKNIIKPENDVNVIQRPDGTNLVRGGLGNEKPVHGTQIFLQFLEYSCGYCGERKISASTGSDGRVRIRCDCGGKHKDTKSRLHAKWTCCTDRPLPENVGIKLADVMDMNPSILGGRPNSCAKRPALAACAPY